jgi:hypothetical protein
MRPRFARVFCGFVFLVVGSAAHAEVSAQTRAKINAAFPAYRPNPPEPKPADPSPAGEPPDGSDVVILPRFYVNESKLGRADPDALLTRQARSEKALRQYRTSTNALERALNSWHIPYLTPSAKARANAAYDQRKNAAEAKRLSDLQKAPGR